MHTTYELVYCSTARPDLTQKDIQNILKESRPHNVKNGITGCLLFYDQEFIQIIEGAKEEVCRLFEKIKNDDRHSAVYLIAEGNKEERSFERWSMAYQHYADENAFNKQFKSNFLRFSDLIEKPTLASEVFWEMSKLILTQS
ncbi:MAG: BLUF domain-containing protein [bacterium]|nr:BLUF domain-containing protein [bacterium]